MYRFELSFSVKIFDTYFWSSILNGIIPPGLQPLWNYKPTCSYPTGRISVNFCWLVHRRKLPGSSLRLLPLWRNPPCPIFFRKGIREHILGMSIRWSVNLPNLPCARSTYNKLKQRKYRGRPSNAIGALFRERRDIFLLYFCKILRFLKNFQV